MLQCNLILLTLGPQNFYHTSMVTPEAKHKTPKPKSQISCWLNSETPIEEVPLLSPCTTPTPPPPPTMLKTISQNSGYIATRDTKLLPHLNGDPRSKTQNPNLKSHATMEL